MRSSRNDQRLSCRANKPSPGQKPICAEASVLRPRRANSCVKKWSMSEKVNTARAPRSKRSPSDCRRHDVRECHSSRQQQVRLRAVPDAARSAITKLGRDNVSHAPPRNDARAQLARRSSASRNPPLLAPRFRARRRAPHGGVRRRSHVGKAHRTPVQRDKPRLVASRCPRTLRPTPKDESAPF